MAALPWALPAFGSATAGAAPTLRSLPLVSLLITLTRARGGHQQVTRGVHPTSYQGVVPVSCGGNAAQDSVHNGVTAALDGA